MDPNYLSGHTGVMHVLTFPSKLTLNQTMGYIVARVSHLGVNHALLNFGGYCNLGERLGWKSVIFHKKNDPRHIYSLVGLIS